MKLANTKRIKDKIMEIAQTKHAFDILNAFFTNGIANSGIAPEMIQVISNTQKIIIAQLMIASGKNIPLNK